MKLDRFYVYALIDPRTKEPFYIGKGTANRLVEHFRDPSSRLEHPSEINKYQDNEDVLVGTSPEEILPAESGEPEESGKSAKIIELKKLGFTPKNIARVVARRVSEDVAFALEALLIKSVYDRKTLTNIADGRGSERFRPWANWDYLEGFDLRRTDTGDFLEDDGTHPAGEFYVYVLRNPETKQIFYVGKGQGGRLGDHFREARRRREVDCKNKRLNELSSLLEDNRYRPEEIGRVMARVNSEALAFIVESFYIKFVLGFRNLHNVQPGNFFGLFRSRGDWELRAGFDIPIIVEKGQERMELLDEFLGDGLDLDLQEVVDLLAQHDSELVLKFSPPKLMGAGELVVLSPIPGIDANVTLRIQIRHARRFQIMLYGVNQAGRRWIREHFIALEAYPLARKDDMFIPSVWRGAANVTSDTQIAVDRALELIGLARTKRREDLGGLAYLLDGLPH